VRALVSRELAVDGATMPAQRVRDLVHGLPLRSHRCDGVSFFAA
jgi:hypothetical protein